MDVDYGGGGVLVQVGVILERAVQVVVGYTEASLSSSDRFTLEVLK